MTVKGNSGDRPFGPVASFSNSYIISIKIGSWGRGLGYLLGYLLGYVWGTLVRPYRDREIV